jgi:3-oxoacyl-[acyl-carrier-protein] synthase-3
VTDRRTIIRSVGSYLPARIMTNDDLSKIVDTSDEWIQQRTGIKQRHIAAEGENTSDLAAAAAKKAMENAGIGIEDIDLIIVATTTPDMTFPATAAVVQQKLGMHHGAAFDIQAVCSGFVYAVATADAYLKNGLGEARAGDRRRDVFAAARLDGPHHLRALRRWRGRHRARAHRNGRGRA